MIHFLPSFLLNLSMITDIAREEMFHMALVGNILYALGGTPSDNEFTPCIQLRSSILSSTWTWNLLRRRLLDYSSRFWSFITICTVPKLSVSHRSKHPNHSNHRLNPRTRYCLNTKALANSICQFNEVICQFQCYDTPLSTPPTVS